jgi:hypothetical protein
VFEVSPLLSGLALTDSRKAVRTLDTMLTAWDAAVAAEREAKEAAKKQKDPIDALEEKLMQNTAVAAAASGTPEQAKDMLVKARAKAMRAASDGADIGSLEAMVRQMEHLAKIAEENRRLKNREQSGGGSAHPAFAAEIQIQSQN